MYRNDLFEGQVVLVTGGNGGIGGSLVSAFLAHGATVVSTDIGSEPKVSHANLTFETLDVTDVASVQNLVRQTVARHKRIDILINAAGVVSSGAAATISELEWDRVLDINLKGTFFVCQAVMETMKRNGYGRIINLGSVLGKNGGNPRPWIDPAEQDKAGNVAYGVSKAGVHALTAYLAKELASHGITVNALAPGPIASAMTTRFPETLRSLIPVGRMGTADEVCTATLFLASRQSAFITGEVLDVNGGLWVD